MRRIGLYLASAPGGGTYQYNQAMLGAVAALAEKKYTPVVVYIEKGWEGYLQPYGLESYYVERGILGRGVGRLLRKSSSITPLWRKLSPWLLPVSKSLVALNCNLWIFPTQDGLSAQIPVPALETVHDLMHRYESRFPEVSENGEYCRREKHYDETCQWAKGVLVDSEVGKLQLVESYGIQPDKVFVLPFTAPNYIYEKGVPPGFDRRYRLPSKFIFYPAQFWEHKNHKSLIRALAELSDLMDIHLVLVGSRKNGYTSIVELIRRFKLDERVHFLGYVPDQDMVELYRRARAMIMPTFFGPTNIPPLEAFAIGCPVAVSNIYGMPEQVGDAALLFDPESVEEIACAIRKLWTQDELCSVLSRKGEQRSNLWGPKEFNENLEQIVTQCLAT